jgi:hypothetical protein
MSQIGSSYISAFLIFFLTSTFCHIPRLVFRASLQ